MLKISVIMGVYNCEDTLERSINSIINQTYKNWELILCDDCSTDNTYIIANNFVEKYSNITLIKNNKNMGLAYSLNRCVEHANGIYLARMDGDDVSFPERFQLQVKILDKNTEYAIVGSSVILFDDTGEKAVRSHPEKPTKYNLICSTPFTHPTVMMRKKSFEKSGRYTMLKRTQRGQDTDLWFKFYANGFKGYNIPTPLLKYKESVYDYKKRSLKVRIRGVKTRLKGYKGLNLPKRYYIFAFKPIITGLIPKRAMYFYHKSIKGRNL